MSWREHILSGVIVIAIVMFAMALIVSPAAPEAAVPDRGGATHWYNGPPPGRLYHWERPDGAICVAWIPPRQSSGVLGKPPGVAMSCYVYE